MESKPTLQMGSVSGGGRTEDPSRTSDLGELVGADEAPFVFTLPCSEGAAGDGRIDLGEWRVFAVVGIHDSALAGVEAFPVVAGEGGGDGG